MQYRSEVRVDGLVVATWGPFGDVHAALLALARSPYLASLPHAAFMVVDAENDALICTSDVRGLSALQEMESERLRQH